ncbi:C4b-binding protein alpha chain-like [Ornithorhynchus anatinus]|uniref:C4b-binding protein alpha chain-like n=1 Tax=Ornithorhynchus anatinus TaxID=9258 RepID=UPI0010A7966E|nr:C4b-binding protein alpha chain-like [Ornithorhynchus anatinus]
MSINCDPGFTMVGNGNISCGLSGLWLPDLPYCRAALSATTAIRGSCEEPTRLTFAIPKPEYQGQARFDVGATVDYTCRPGYRRTPSLSPRITCLASGTWSKPPSFCQPKPCPNPEDLLNGRIEIEDIVFGSTIFFRCNNGYTLIGSSQSSCEITENNRVDWSETHPVCEIIKCLPPPDISDGVKVQNEDEYSFGSVVSYKCNKGFSLIGLDSIHCTSDNHQSGKWSGDPPECKVVRCENPIVQNGHQISTSAPPYSYMNYVIFQCNRGFVMEGKSKIYCGANNLWFPKIPRCKREGDTDEPGDHDDPVEPGDPDDPNNSRIPFIYIRHICLTLAMLILTFVTAGELN